MSIENVILGLDSVSKRFVVRKGWIKNRFNAIHDISFALQKNKPEILAIVGESGSGKSTIAKILLELETPTTGRVIHDGRYQTKKSRRERKNRLLFRSDVQPIFQDPFGTFNPLKPIDGYLRETAASFRVGEPTDEVMDSALHKVGLSLSEIQGRYPGELSGGQLQRISIARALIVQPSVLVADEPHSMVDASLTVSIVNLFKSLKETMGISVVYITHNLATAQYISDNIIVLHRGETVECGPIEDVLTQPRHPYTQDLIASIPKPDPSQKWDDKVVDDQMEETEYTMKGCKYANRCSKVMERCRRQDPDKRTVDRVQVKCFLYD